jgi:histidinol-phosphate aminotransferase
LSTLDFMRQVTYQEVSVEAARVMAEPTRILAMSEGLPAHAMAAALRSQAPSVNCEHAGTATPRPLPLRDAYRDIELYEPGRVPCPVDLSDNTNLHGVPPSARAVLAAERDDLVTRYPTVYSRDLKSVIARQLDVAYENVLTGCGSDDILDSAIRAFCEPGDRVVFPAPTFGVVDLFARMNGATAFAIPHTPDLELDVNALADTRAAVTYICNPNNPTGTAYSRDSIVALARTVDGILIIDEAYASYADFDCIDLALSSNRVLIVRTMSKAYGLAGLRVGYAIGSAELIREVEKSRGPYKVGALAEAAAAAAISRDGEWVTGHVADVRRNRGRLSQILAGMGLAPLPSASNFLLVPLPDGAHGIGSRLLSHGVAVRVFTDLPGIGDAIRVTIGPWALMERFVTAFADTLQVAGL